ncbi:DeoR/GlpR family DNA-binding transcription regulator [uncultured Cetobacterium sp.]|uniref:DeoR/GlpR family DNA-binding transcription regulator n=1 Tax=uncultured Cetobacterium sp. TaxID=527638 RepID=UPI00261ECD38|nr:DeoR/GlpR family DNA-binding transcription regulator [uncultured Cetobacterium sp.]
MLNIERENSILELLKQKESIKIKEIVTLLNISEATARRDLSSLEKKELLKRVHGGAILNISSNISKDFNIQYRKNINRTEKEKIAKLAVSFIQNDSCIFLDAGTTTLEMIKYLKALNLKVVTNGLNLIEELENYEIESYLIGGKIKSKTSCTTGFSAVEYLKTFNFDCVFIGANAFNLDGYSTPDSEEAMVKSQAISRGNNIFFLCDNSKFEKNSFINFSSLRVGTLITDSVLPKEYYQLTKVEVTK